MICGNCSAPIRPGTSFCSSCGAAVAPQQTPPTTPRLLQPPVGPPAGLDAPHLSATPTHPQPRRRRARRYVALGFGVVGLAAAAYVGYSLFGSQPSGGASSPEAAVEDMVAAVNAEDALGLAQVLSPAEVEELQELVGVITTTATDLGITGLSPGEGMDLRVDLLGSQVDELSDDAALVELRFEAEADASGLSGVIAELLPDLAGGLDDADVAEFLEGAGSGEVFVIAVREGGGWYVSPMLTVGEYVTRVNDLPAGDYDTISEDTDAGGPRADSAEEAVEQLFDAVAELDAREWAQALGNGEARFVRVFENAIDDLLDRTSYSLEFENLQVSELEDGRVALDEVDVSASDGYESAGFTIHRDCAIWSDSYDGSRQKRCALSNLPLTSQLDERRFVFHTTTEDGRHVARLFPSLVEVVTEIAERVDRPSLLLMAGTPQVDDAITLPASGVVSQAFDGSLYQVVEFTVEAERAYAVSAEADGGSELYERDDDGNWRYEDCCDVITIEPGVARQLRALLYSEARCDDDAVITCSFTGDGEFELSVQPIQVQALEQFPSITAGEIGSSGQVWFTFDVTEPMVVRFDEPNDDVEFSLDGPYTWDGDAHRLEPGSYTLRVINYGETSSEFRVDMSLAPDRGFLAGTTVVMDLSSGSASEPLRLIGGDEFEVVAQPLDGQDIVLRLVEDSGATACEVDVGFGGGSERCSLIANVDLTLDVIVEGYGSSNSYGMVEVSVYFE